MLHLLGPKSGKEKNYNNYFCIILLSLNQLKRTSPVSSFKTSKEPVLQVNS